MRKLLYIVLCLLLWCAAGSAQAADPAAAEPASPDSFSISLRRGADAPEEKAPAADGGSAQAAEPAAAEPASPDSFSISLRRGAEKPEAKAPAAAAKPDRSEEISSIDALDKGVADTGETSFTKTDKKVTECTQPYTVAVLPFMDTSGLEGRSREMAVGAVKDMLKKKYPAKKTSVTRIAANNAVQRALIDNPMENPETPSLQELVRIGEACGADRVIFISILPAREKETGFMVIAGTQTYSATVMMKLKCVDVNEEKYLFNQNVEGIGSSTSINFWMIGQPSRAKAVKRGVTDCMTFFLTSFD